MKIFVINPGSTSTKIALFIDEKPVWAAGAHHTADDLSEFHHVNEQYAYRKDFVLRLLAEADIPLDFDAVIARGGLLKPTPGGVYAINEQMKHDLLNARMEHACTLDELCAAAGRLVRTGGRFALVHRPERLADLLEALRSHGLEPKRLRLVQNTAQAAPKLLLLEAKKGGRPGLAVLPPLLLRDPDGGESAELSRIYFRDKE